MTKPTMEWPRLINDMRFGLEHYHDPRKSATRSDFRRDYDRLVFSSPFRWPILWCTPSYTTPR